MSSHSKIEWCDATWNPVRGCSRVSEGCRHCYAEMMAARFNKPGQWGHGFAEMVTRPGGNREARWTGLVKLDRSKLALPFEWRKPRRISVNSTSDLFHESLDFSDIDKVFAMMGMASHHTFLVLTKRPERMRQYAAEPGFSQRMGDALKHARAPLPNVWLGTSVEDQATADERIPSLLATPAAGRFISAEPLLGPLDIQLYIDSCHAARDGDCIWPSCPQLRDGEPARSGRHCPIDDWDTVDECEAPPKLDWVIVGGESGPGARPMHPAWVRSIRDQCAAAGVPFFFKQWGEWLPTDHDRGQISFGRHKRHGWDIHTPQESWSYRVGKKAAGRLLDGVTHDALPPLPITSPLAGEVAAHSAAGEGDT